MLKTGVQPLRQHLTIPSFIPHLLLNTWTPYSMSLGLNIDFFANWMELTQRPGPIERLWLKWSWWRREIVQMTEWAMPVTIVLAQKTPTRRTPMRTMLEMPAGNKTNKSPAILLFNLQPRRRWGLCVWPEWQLSKSCKPWTRGCRWGRSRRRLWQLQIGGVIIVSHDQDFL